MLLGLCTKSLHEVRHFKSLLRMDMSMSSQSKNLEKKYSPLIWIITKLKRYPCTMTAVDTYQLFGNQFHKSINFRTLVFLCRVLFKDFSIRFNVMLLSNLL